MDHSQMGHAMPDMPDMPDMDDAMCNMNMIFTWDWRNLCVIFKWWHIRSFSGFVFSLLAIVSFGIIYEYLRSRVKKLGNKTTPIRLTAADDDDEQPVTNKHAPGAIKSVQRSVLYAALVGYSYLMMLVFMTYNGWVMLSVVIGAGIGNYLFDGEINESLACH